MRARIGFTLVASLTLTAGALAACGDDDDDAADTTVAAAPQTTAPAAETTAAPADTTAAPTETSAGGTDTTAAAGTGFELTLADTDLGSIVADAEGRTLYIFTQDTGGTSTCEAGCAEAWPPAVTEGEPTAGEGIDAADLGTITRSDGDLQVTYYGKPLYYFASDLAPGDTSGQGSGGVWFVIDAEGNQIEG